jgi:nicotinate-nucleotide adenylyltransferase
LAALKAKYPEHDFFLILGEDSLADLPKWRNPGEVLRQTGILIYPREETRPGVDAKIAQELLERSYPETNISWINGVPKIGIASRDLREKCLLGQSIRYLVSPAVEEFIRQKHLYCGK